MVVGSSLPLLFLNIFCLPSAFVIRVSTVQNPELVNDYTERLRSELK